MESKTSSSESKTSSSESKTSSLESKTSSLKSKTPWATSSEKSCTRGGECYRLSNRQTSSAAGEVAHVKVPQMYTHSKSMLAAITYTGIVEVCPKINKVGQGGGTKSQDFYAFLNLVMDKLDGRNLKYKGWNIICDNAPIHTAHYIANRVSERIYKLVLLPRYSPFLNPIENFFSKVKLLFRHIDDNINFIDQTSENQTEDLEQRLTSSLAKVTLSDYVDGLIIL
ncbi:hypothetical protein INT45_003769 [Circinella minor]|uniref:Tc1-like transposase DDE domain-containing protein n=1 Tax=Circinella minor TaxID=1195481 RepID=A0A8H7RLU0_9FUNG|nr:hypothetical protein INT45_003769 [Circinella minor]